ncbi:DUF1634 domain-containing protein [Mucilaginibacter sp. CSA2-8R]|uniref:DUF1634 domain-containing protein n=1 Tax=Mucilaginibacter sp. CSA2-8R TaxID=3141542 RepID=UPI00315DD2CC
MMKKVKGLLGDHDIEVIVGTLLRYGVMTASAIVLAGGIYFLIQHGQAPVPSYHRFVGESVGFTTFSGILKGVADLQAKAIIQLGVMVLIATPIFRILFSLVGFTLEKDKLYIAITLVVLCVIMLSTFGGLKI